MHIHVKRIMRILIGLFLMALIAAFSGTVYIGAITLPVKARTAIVNEFEKATGKKFIFQSLKFSLVKGLILERPVLYEDTAILARAGELSARFLIIPVFHNKIVIPAVVVERPHILLERYPDNSFNMAGILSAEYLSEKNANFSVYKVSLRNGSINFVDRTFQSPVIKKIDGVNTDIRLALPAKIAFKGSCRIPAPGTPIEMNLKGAYSLPDRELSADINVKNLVPNEFKDYYSASGFSFRSGLLDSDIRLNIKDGLANMEASGEARDIALSKDGIDAKLKAGIKVSAEYDVKAGSLEYAGKLDIEKMDIDAKDTFGTISNIKAKVEFNDSRLSSKDIRAEVFGIPWTARINLVNFDKPVFDIYASADTYLGAVKKILKDDFKMDIPADIAGKSTINVAIQSEPGQALKLNGYIKMHDATINARGGKYIIEHLNGEAQFTPNTFAWSDLELVCRDISYKTSGVLTNFNSPGIQIKIASKDMSIESLMAVENETVVLSKFTGKFKDSIFSLTGEIYTKESGILDADISGAAYFSFNDLKKILKDSSLIDKMKLAGNVNAEFALKGNIDDIKKCGISAKARSNRIYLYGLKLDGVSADYIQTAARGDIKSMKASFYGGSLFADGEIDWTAKDIAYRANLEADDIKLEELKKDTAIKDKDVSGDISMNAGISGIFNDTSSVSGKGALSVTNGKLWQLNLFNGLGSIIFTSDFSEVIFTEGSCNFRIDNKAFSTRNLNLKSELLNLFGAGEIGFDKSVRATLKSELTEEAMDEGFKKNIATMIGRYTSIGISGTVADPKYAIQTSPADIIGGFAKTYFEQ